MSRALTLLPLLALFACDGGDTDGTTDGTDTDDTNTLPPQEQPLTQAPTGDLTCVTPAVAFDDVVWAADQVLQDMLGQVTVDVTVEDFEQETPTPGRTVQTWFDDVVEGTPDTTGNTDANGAISITAPACSEFAYLTKQLEGLEEAKETYKSHMVFGPDQPSATFQSVSISTYRLIPTVLGLSIEPNKGAIAGTAYDCSRDPALLSSDDTGKMRNVRVRLKSCPAADSEPADCTGEVTGPVVKYFVDNFPSRDQGYTSPDGLWGFFNVPEGTYRIEAYGLIDGEEQIFGATTVTVKPDSINIGNIWAGRPDGVKYPSTCEASEEVASAN